jgi:hypothetical protein
LQPFQGALDFRDFYFPDIESQVESARPHLGFREAKANQVAAWHLRSPCVAPQSPGIICGLVEIIHRDVIFFGIETNLQTLRRFASAPENTDDAIFDFARDAPLER